MAQRHRIIKAIIRADHQGRYPGSAIQAWNNLPAQARIGKGPNRTKARLTPYLPPGMVVSKKLKIGYKPKAAPGDKLAEQAHPVTKL